MRILITGATGFMGVHLVRKLAEKGNKCRCLVRQSSDIEMIRDIKDIEFVVADICNENTLKDAFKDIEIVIHLAAQLGSPEVTYEQFYEVNVKGTKNVLEAAYKARVKQVIFCSTPGVQGKGIEQSIEDLPYSPPYDYEKTKMEAEKIIFSYHRKRKDFVTTIIRPDFVYGPNDYRRITLYKAIKEKKFFVLGNGKNVVQPTYIDDAVEGILLVLDNPIAFGEVYNIAGPCPITINEYAKEIASALGVKLPLIKIPKNLAYIVAFCVEKLYPLIGKKVMITRRRVEFLTLDHGSDTSKAKAHLGYNAEIDFSEGIKKTVNWLAMQNFI